MAHGVKKYSRFSEWVSLRITRVAAMGQDTGKKRGLGAVASGMQQGP